MKSACNSHAFTAKESIKSIVYQIRNFKQKTTNVSVFKAHIGRKPITTLVNLSTTPNSAK